MSSTRALVSLALVGALCATAVRPGAGAPQDQQPSETPTFRGGIDAVRVDVIVTDDDNEPVTDLTVDDFLLYEDGAPKDIADFTVVRIGESAKEYNPPQILSTLEEEAEAARDDVRLFLIYMAIPPGGLSRGRGADDIVEPLVRFVRSLDPIDMVGIMDPYTPIQSVMLTRDRDWIVRTLRSYADEDVRMRHERAILNRDLIIEPRRLIDGLEAASMRLAALREGRQSIILVGGGITAQSSEYTQLLRTLNRNNTSVYPFSPGRERPGMGRDLELREFAELTGAHAILNRYNIDEDLASITRDASFYYLLTYDSSAPADGKFHRIVVRVKRPQLRVRARSGFWAFSDEELLRAAARPEPDGPVLDALGTIAPARLDDLTAHTWIGTARGENGRTRVTFVWEPTASAAARDETPARVSLVARGSGGTVLFEGVSPEGDSSTTAGRAVRHAVTFDVPPGPVDLRATFQSTEGDLLDAEAHSIEVPDYASADAAISTPRVFVARTLPELRRLLADPAAVPTPGREVMRSDRLFVRFEAYGTAAPRAALLNRTGEQMSTFEIPPPQPDGTFQFEIGITNVPPGEYLIAIKPAPDSRARTLIPLRIKA